MLGYQAGLENEWGEQMYVVVYECVWWGRGGGEAQDGRSVHITWTPGPFHGAGMLGPQGSSDAVWAYRGAHYFWVIYSIL